MGDNGGMTEHIAASNELYIDTAKETEGARAENFASALDRKAAALDQLTGEETQAAIAVSADETREAAETVLKEGQSPEQVNRIKNHLKESAKVVRTELGGAIMKKLPGNAAAQARLGTDGYWVDPYKLYGHRDARAKKIHELEHTQQSPDADAEEITIGKDNYEAWEVRELGAMGAQREVVPESMEMVSTEYQDIAAGVTVDAKDRELIRQGRFREFEARKNGLPEFSKN
jgi:hypothetical protein